MPLHDHLLHRQTNHPSTSTPTGSVNSITTPSSTPSSASTFEFPTLTIPFGGADTNVLVDTSADISCISSYLFEAIDLHTAMVPNSIQEIVTATGDIQYTLGSARLLMHAPLKSHITEFVIDTGFASLQHRGYPQSSAEKEKMDQHIGATES
ncbi:hypothetical protein BGX24_012230 [Mortierella sp. AD032]|nr:hypothetical protein BGX24_012230 [Mortierella sp. AD032]